MIALRAPGVPAEEDHREKVVKVAKFINAMVSRPAGRAEMLTNTKAMDSMKKEWKGLIDQGVFNLSVIRECYDVAREAKQKNEEVHMARAHGVIVEKHSQLSEEDPRRKYKGRGVVLGNQIKNQTSDAALFQDLGNSPATFEASRWADFLGCLDGLDVQMADAVQAYIQATLRGTPCWIELPAEAVPEDDKERWNQFKRPVVRLVKALYSHPDAGTFWEQHCDESVRSMSFQPVGEEWPSVLPREKLIIEPETGLDLYLGCNQSKGTVVLGNGHQVTTVTYDMEQFLRSCVDRYLEVAGNVEMKKLPTPGPHEETKDHPSRAPIQTGPSVECNWCGNRVPANGYETPSCQAGGTSEGAHPEPVREHLAPHAASVLMKIL